MKKLFLQAATVGLLFIQQPVVNNATAPFDAQVSFEVPGQIPDPPEKITTEGIEIPEGKNAVVVIHTGTPDHEACGEQNDLCKAIYFLQVATGVR